MQSWMHIGTYLRYGTFMHYYFMRGNPNMLCMAPAIRVYTIMSIVISYILRHYVYKYSKCRYGRFLPHNIFYVPKVLFCINTGITWYEGYNNCFYSVMELIDKNYR